jgi:shikimate kinase/3-dehydroquinate synthase
MERIVELMQQRQEDYGKFPQMVTSEKSPDAVTKNLVGIFQANPDQRVPITGAGKRYEYIVGGGLLPFVKNLAGIAGPVAVITDTQYGAFICAKLRAGGHGHRSAPRPAA